MFLDQFRTNYGLEGSGEQRRTRRGGFTKQFHLSLFFKVHELEGNFQKNFLPYKLNPFSPPSVPVLLTKSSS